ncbi:molybdopterin-dependent oxidoreductase, partial [Streptomyces sp. SID7982]|nr:molybdopterin-dependent oxidoreductase [Streptomyces sp. SID7982]
FAVWDEEHAAPRAHRADRVLARPETVALTGTHRFTDAIGRERTARPAFALLAERCEEWTPARVSAATWLDEDDLRAFYDLLGTHRRVAYYSWTGIGQHTNATQTERAVAVLYALTGACDRPGGNVWLAAPEANPLHGFDLLSEKQRAKALGLAELPLGPARRGWISARHFRRAVLDGTPYPVRALVAFGSNLVVTQAGSRANAEALRALDLQVHIDLFLNPTAATADYVLPANSPWEHEALRIGFEITQEAVEHIQLRQAMIPPVGLSRPDYAIAVDLACRLGLSDDFFGGSIDAGWNHQLAPTGLTVEQLRRSPGGVRVPRELVLEKHTRPAPGGGVRGFLTPTNRVELYSETLLDHGHDPLPTATDPLAALHPPGTDPDAYPLVLTTHKNGVFVHSSHRHVASLRRRSPEPTVDMHPDLAARRGLEEGQLALVATPGGDVTLRVRLDEDLHPSVVLAEFGWWEECPPLGRAATPAFGPGTANINAVLDDAAHDPVSGSVPLRAVACDVRPAPRTVGQWTMPRRFTVSALRHPTPDVLALSMTPCDGAGLPPVRPGQHVLVESASRPGLTRAYSVTEARPGSGVLGIAVKHVPGGEMSGHLHRRLAVGDTVWLR